MKKRIIAVWIVIAMITLLISETGVIKDKTEVAKAYTVSLSDVEWNVSALQAEAAYDDSKSGAPIKIAVLDSGLDYDPNIPYEERKDFLGENEEELHPVFQDTTGHGTSVASLICARKSDTPVAGLSANAKLYVARILDENNNAPVSRVIEAIDWAIEKDVKIIHMSFGTTGDYEELRAAIKRAYEKGILIVAAAGNRGTAEEDESTVEYPAAYDEVLSVGATNTDAVKTEISSNGEELDIVAPGDQILTTGAFGGLSVQEGTSMAAAQVTGIAAALWGRYPDKSCDFIKGLMIGSANKSPSLKNCGNGLVDYKEAKAEFDNYNETYLKSIREGKSEKEAIKKAELRLDNENELRTYSNIGYVNGSWGGNTHQSFDTDPSDKKTLNKLLSQTDIQIVKKGAITPDDEEIGLQNAKCFHGYGNYLAHTKYMMEVAKTFYYEKKTKDKDGKKKSIKIPKYNDIFESKNPYNKVKAEGKDDIRFWFESTRGNMAAKYGLNTNKKKGLLYMGCALHIAMDAFAHRGYREFIIEEKKDKNNQNSSSWYLIQHRKASDSTHVSWYWNVMKNQMGVPENLKKKYELLFDEFTIADMPEELPERINVARKVAVSLLGQFKDSSKKKELPNVLSAFNTGIKSIFSKNSQNIPFRLENISSYMNEISKKTDYSYIKKLHISQINATGAKNIRFSYVGKSNKIASISFDEKFGQEYMVWGKKGKRTVELYRGRADKNKKVSVTVLLKNPDPKDKADYEQAKALQRDEKQVNVNSFTIKAINVSSVKNEVAKIKCTIHFKKGDKKAKGDNYTQSIEYRTIAPKIKENKFTKKGYTFKGWSLKQKSKKIRYTNRHRFEFDDLNSVTLYPVFKKKEKKKK